MEQLQKLLPNEDLFGLVGRSYVMSSYRDFNAMRLDMSLSHYRHLPGIFVSRDFNKLIEALKMKPCDVHVGHTCLNMLNSSITQEELAHHCSLSKNVTFSPRGSALEHPWRWCLDCVNEDIENYGIPYYHRDHQVPGVNRCLKHQCGLVTQCHNCQYEILDIKRQPIPPFDIRCPKCGSDFQKKESFLNTRMAAVESLCVDMVYGRLKISQQELAHRVQCYLGISQEDIDLDIARGSIRSFHRDIMNFYRVEELEEYFSRIHEFKQGISCPAIKGARAYNINSTGIPLHPLAVAVIWHFLNEMLDKRMVA